jgi:hypothetical protein
MYETTSMMKPMPLNILNFTCSGLEIIEAYFSYQMMGQIFLTSNSSQNGKPSQGSDQKFLVLGKRGNA